MRGTRKVRGRGSRPKYFMITIASLELCFGFGARLLFALGLFTGGDKEIAVKAREVALIHHVEGSVGAGHSDIDIVPTLEDVAFFGEGEGVELLHLGRVFIISSI